MTPKSADVQLSEIGQIAITVRDLDRAIAFYRDTLGMRFLFRVPNLAFFDCGGIRLMLSPPERPEESFSSIIYYKVADIEETFAALSARGVAFEGQPHRIAQLQDHDLWMAFFRDPDRNLLALMSEVKRG